MPNPNNYRKVTKISAMLPHLGKLVRTHRS
jgi:hypothetical protein